jgi:hypothetical protein
MVPEGTGGIVWARADESDQRAKIMAKAKAVDNDLRLKTI